MKININFSYLNQIWNINDEGLIYNHPQIYFWQYKKTKWKNSANFINIYGYFKPPLTFHVHIYFFQFIFWQNPTLVKKGLKPRLPIWVKGLDFRPLKGKRRCLQNSNGYDGRWSWKSMLLNCEGFQNCRKLQRCKDRRFLGEWSVSNEWVVAIVKGFWVCWGFYLASCSFFTCKRPQISLHCCFHLLFWTFVCTLLLLFEKCKFFLHLKKLKTTFVVLPTPLLVYWFSHFNPSQQHPQLVISKVTEFECIFHGKLAS
jgi:hypothetical protein